MDAEEEDGRETLFLAPQTLLCVRCHGATVCAGGVDGAVLFLRVPFLTA